MNYTYDNQEKALKHLIDNSPHDIKKFENLYAVESETNHKPEITVRDILFSKVWTVKEKIQLIKLYGHDKSSDFTYKTYEREIGYMVGIEGLPLIDECIQQDNLSGVKALLSLDAHISVATIARIIENIKDPAKRYKFCETIVKHYANKEKIEVYIGTGNQCYLKEIPSLCDRYAEYTSSWRRELWTTVSSMKNICSTNDLKLVKLFLPTVKNIKPLLMHAINSENTKMVQMFIDAGADVNFQDTEFENDNNRRLFKIPLKLAIDNNDLEMVKFLHQNGADLDFVSDSDRIKEFVANLGRSAEEKETNQFSDYWDREDYITWTKTPLEYAVYLGPASIIEQDLVNNRTKRSKEKEDKQVQDRMAIINYLYKNGATFGTNGINYTDLICYAAVAKNIDTARFYFEEAMQKGCKVDFKKIVSMILKPPMPLQQYYAPPYFPTKTNPFFELCKEYSEKIDSENHENNIILMLEVLFGEVSSNAYRFNQHYKEIITEFTALLQPELIKEIPIIFHTPFEDIDYILSLGYSIQHLNKSGDNILMNYIQNGANLEKLLKLIALGVDVNYQLPETGFSALSYAILQLPKCDFGKYLDYLRHSNVKEKFAAKKQRAIIEKLVELSSEDIVKSPAVEETVYRVINPGYPQILYNDMLEILAKKGLTVTDEYFTESIAFSTESYSDKYVTDPQGFLRNLYNNFSNTSIETKKSFPQIEKAKDYKVGTKENQELFNLVKTNIDRTFITKPEQILEKAEGRSAYDEINGGFVDVSPIEVAQRTLVEEIMRYIGSLSGGQILELVDRYPMININTLFKNSNFKPCNLLSLAMEQKDIRLCKELIKRGASIVYYDNQGHDVTPKLFTNEEIEIFITLDGQYNSNQECEYLLLAIGENLGPKKDMVMRSKKTIPTT